MRANAGINFALPLIDPFQITILLKSQPALRANAAQPFETCGHVRCDDSVTGQYSVKRLARDLQFARGLAHAQGSRRQNALAKQGARMASQLVRRTMRHGDPVWLVRCPLTRIATLGSGALQVLQFGASASAERRVSVLSPAVHPFAFRTCTLQAQGCRLFFHCSISRRDGGRYRNDASLCA